MHDKQVFSLLAAGGLILLSAMFSGLTLGVLGLDLVGLRVVRNGGGPASNHAAKIIPVRAHGNWLLCTLLLGNVAVNAALSIVLAEQTSGTTGFLLSTAVITVFGEILPQSVCSRHGLAIGAFFVLPVKLFMFILAPVAYPVSRLLDLALGKELGQIYSKDEFRELVNIHRSAPGNPLVTEGAIIAGAFDFGCRTVSDVMTPTKDVFMLEISQRLDFSTLMTIFKSGFSRIPCYDKTKTNGDNILGVLFVKDLLLLDPKQELPVVSALNLSGKVVPRVFPDYPVAHMLQDFKSGCCHLATVMDVDSSGLGDPFYVLQGIVTLEDILELILQDEIYDETDQAARPIHELSCRMNIFKPRMSVPRALSAEEELAILYHLRGYVDVFKPDMHPAMSETAIKHLISTCTVVHIPVDVGLANRASFYSDDAASICDEANIAISIDNEQDDYVTDTPLLLSPCDLKSQQHTQSQLVKISAPGLVLYDTKHEADSFSLVLDGLIDVSTDSITSSVGKWTCLCSNMLTNIWQQYNTGLIKDTTDISSLNYVPNFTARVSTKEPARVIQISQQDYLDAIAKYP